MIYTLTICFGMWMSLCGSVRTFEYPTLEDCDRARMTVPASAIGKGYAVCALTQGRKQ
jgi:hypothetical protein